MLSCLRLSSRVWLNLDEQAIGIGSAIVATCCDELIWAVGLGHVHDLWEGKQD